MNEHISESLGAYIDGAVSGDERQRIERHIAQCAECARAYDDARNARASIAGAGIALPAITRERIVQAYDAQQRAARPRSSSSWLRMAAVIALALGTGAVGYVLGARQGEEPAPPVAVERDERPGFLLLLEEPIRPRGPMRSGYSEWTRALAATRSMVSAAKLEHDPGVRVFADGTVQTPDPDDATSLSGFYLIRANSYEEAIEWARNGPHLDYGSILIRQLD